MADLIDLHPELRARGGGGMPTIEGRVAAIKARRGHVQTFIVGEGSAARRARRIKGYRDVTIMLAVFGCLVALLWFVAL